MNKVTLSLTQAEMLTLANCVMAAARDSQAKGRFYRAGGEFRAAAQVWAVADYDNMARMANLAAVECDVLVDERRAG
jgi:hypothetical protein